MTTRSVAIRRPAWADRTPARAVVAAAVLAAALVAGAVGGRSVAPHATPAPAPRVVQAGPARLALPADWRPTTLASARVVGLDPQSAVALETYPGSFVRVVAAFTKTDDASLIPQAFRDLLGTAPSHPRSTRLAGWPAWHYAPRPTATGDGTLELTVVPTTRGVLTVACLWPAADLSAGCAPAPEVVTVADAAPLVPSKSLALGLYIPTVLRPLDRARVNGRAVLARAATPSAQAASARRLARAYRIAAASLHSTTGPAGAALEARLLTARRAYAHLGSAAMHGSLARFAAARDEVNEAERNVAAALAELKAATSP
jgi:hypothetical protein